MIFREANINDVNGIQRVRNSVNENRLSNPALVSDDDVCEFILNKGRGWVCEVDDKITGFAIVDLKGNNVWALFVEPGFLKKGIGKKLHQLMLDWYFDKTKQKIWLSTAPNSRAETFYRMNGWKEAGLFGKGEKKFEMNFSDWKSQNQNHYTYKI
jgi:GNAT superfamily N-acetyltransferase